MPCKANPVNPRVAERAPWLSNQSARKRGRKLEMPGGDDQRRRDDDKNKICVFEVGRGRGGKGERKIVQNAVFRGKRHDNKILKVQILLSRNFCYHCAGS